MTRSYALAEDRSAVTVGRTPARHQGGRDWLGGADASLLPHRLDVTGNIEAVGGIWTVVVGSFIATQQAEFDNLPDRSNNRNKDNQEPPSRFPSIVIALARDANGYPEIEHCNRQGNQRPREIVDLREGW